MVTKIQRRNKIKTRIRGKISGTAQRPRMTVFRSNKQIYVQLVDDLAGKTLVSASSRGLEAAGTKSEVAAQVGYSNGKFFNQIFRKALGTTPREYRKARK